MEGLLQNNIIKYINLSVVNKNTDKLKKIHNEIKNIYNLIDKNLFTINKNNDKCDFIITQINKTQLIEFEQFNLYVKAIKNVTELSYKNIIFYTTDNINIEKSKEMLKIALTFAEYRNITNNITIIWCPINKNRDFNFKEINDKTLKESIKNFDAFSSSGLTIGNLTFVTRIEEAEKLLLHELIHNYDIDGSNYHKNLDKVINTYEKTKNIKHYKYDYCLYESYAELLSSYFSMIFRNIDDPNRIEIEIIIEILYSYNTVCNIIKLNGYTNIDDFITNGYFKGDICFYEYYYLKALMYNNFVLKFGTTFDDFVNIYETIIEIKPDKLLKQIFYNSYKQKNYKYIFY